MAVNVGCADRVRCMTGRSRLVSLVFPFWIFGRDYGVARFQMQRAVKSGCDPSDQSMQALEKVSCSEICLFRYSHHPLRGFCNLARSTGELLWLSDVLLTHQTYGHWVANGCHCPSTQCAAKVKCPYSRFLHTRQLHVRTPRCQPSC